MLKDYLENEKFVDNLIIFQDQDNNYSQLYDLVKKYRKYVNKNLLLAMVNICGRPADSSEFDELFTHQNDLNIRGFSDSVFNMIVNKGNGGQLEAVENIDKKYNLINLRNPLLQTFLGNEEATVATFGCEVYHSGKASAIQITPVLESLQAVRDDCPAERPRARHGCGPGESLDGHGQRRPASQGQEDWWRR